MDVSSLPSGLHRITLSGNCQRNLRVTTAGSGYSQYDTVLFGYSTTGAMSSVGVMTPTAWLKTAGSLTDANLEWIDHGANIDHDHGGADDAGLSVVAPYMTTTTGSSGVVVLDHGAGFLQSILVYEKPLAT
jgi:hypothetical protein